MKIEQFEEVMSGEGIDGIKQEMEEEGVDSEALTEEELVDEAPIVGTQTAAEVSSGATETLENESPVVEEKVTRQTEEEDKKKAQDNA